MSSASYFPVFSGYFLGTFTVPDARHGGHCVHQTSVTEPPTVWWGRRETQHPQGAEEEIPGLQGRREKTATEEEISTVSPVHRYGECTISGEQDGRANITHKERECVSGGLCYVHNGLYKLLHGLCGPY